eukprot:gnl/TRDRNA2_/TRDRNA2_169855_c4_seq3.p1 gnl/TRDRNA2_/TRDRNA2_169855_c4~~gnl/TRDRNA2_/TRDRNA2_169855_c4_seq3.p1  ORF type:complete len:193 (-),score=32.23 gnl/TRDRNA2_/TRDRNA2_169855_c4_seq3:54-593(-)
MDAAGRLKEFEGDSSTKRPIPQGISEDDFDEPQEEHHIDEVEHEFWSDSLSYTERAKIHLSRALIMNPEVLVLQRPLCHFDRSTGLMMLDALKKHVSDRGYRMSQATVERRRPRSLFLSPTTDEEKELASILWEVRHEDTEVRELTFTSTIVKKPEVSVRGPSDLTVEVPKMTLSLIEI